MFSQSKFCSICERNFVTEVGFEIHLRNNHHKANVGEALSETLKKEQTFTEDGDKSRQAPPLIKNMDNFRRMTPANARPRKTLPTATKEMSDKVPLEDMDKLRQVTPINPSLPETLQQGTTDTEELSDKLHPASPFDVSVKVSPVKELPPFAEDQSEQFKHLPNIKEELTDVFEDIEKYEQVKRKNIVGNFKCQECDRSYTTKSSLYRHMQVSIL